MRMSEQEILLYRSTGIPDDVQAYMTAIAALAKRLDLETDETRKAQVREQFLQLLKDAKDRTDHYYMKRIRDFGIHNMRLKKLSESFSELISQFQL